MPRLNNKTITTRWIYKIKSAGDNCFKYKARLVARGFQHEKEYDISKIYAPVSRLPTVRLLFSLANKYHLKMHQLDVKTAFLNGTINEDVYIEIPEGFKDCDKLKGEFVCKLNKALYGPKTSPKRWNVKFRDEMIKFGMTLCDKESCVYYKRKDDDLVILTLYVDDIIIFGTHDKNVQKIIKHLQNAFEMVYMGEPKKYLGMEIDRDLHKGIIKLHQKQYIHKILKRFQMVECNPNRTPMGVDALQLSKEMPLTEEEKKLKHVEYREKIGLLYLANCTRPDIAFPTNWLSRKQLNCTLKDVKDVSRIMKYLKGTETKGLTYLSKTDDISAYADASYVTDVQTGTSTSGVVIKVFRDTVNWISRRQKV